jgi:hypothetical protein
MSGSGQLFVQPSQAGFGAMSKGIWGRAIPTPGVPFLSLPAVGGVASCRNLIAASPPTLLEEYEIYNLVIGYTAVILLSAAAPDIVVEVEATLLINDRPAYTNSTPPQDVSGADGVEPFASGAWTADLVNPISVGARDRLGLRVGVMASADNIGANVIVGMQTAYVFPTGAVALPYESTISYRTVNVPAAHRL